MATSFKKTVIKTFPRVGGKISNDTLYWKHLEFPITRKSFGAVTHIDVSPSEPYNYAVTSSTKVEIFSSETHEVFKTLTKFRRQAYSGSFRADGKLIVAGGEEGLVRVFDVARKSLLRTFKGHKRPVHVTRFTRDNMRVMSGGDDNTLRLYDVPSEAEMISYTEHEDYIRGGAVSFSSNDIVMTGSYDHTARLFDTRMRDSVLSLNHGCPVECVLIHPGGSLLYTAGGETIKVWDALAGGRLVASLKNHHKTITALGFCSDYKRLVSAGLDRHVNIYDISTYQVVHTLDYMSALLSVGIPVNDSSISVGMTDGHLVTQRRVEADHVEQQKLKQKREKKSHYRFQFPAKSYEAQEDNIVIDHTRKEHLAKYDIYFRKFEYGRALTAALDMRVRTKQPEVTFSVMQELIRRSGIKIALAGRDEKMLLHIITFLIKNLSNPKYTNIAVDVSFMLIDIYKNQLCHSAQLTQKMRQLKSLVEKELALIKELHEITGILDTIFATSHHSRTRAVRDNGFGGINKQLDQDGDLALLPTVMVNGTIADDTSDSSSSEDVMEVS